MYYEISKSKWLVIRVSFIFTQSPSALFRSYKKSHIQINVEMIALAYIISFRDWLYSRNGKVVTALILTEL